MSLPEPEEWPRITDLSCIEPENFKFRNTQFLISDNYPYKTGQGHSKQELRRQIWNVRNGDLRRVLEEFPRDEPLREQCALWMHAVVGKHFFPDRITVLRLRSFEHCSGRIPSRTSDGRSIGCDEPARNHIPFGQR